MNRFLDTKLGKERVIIGPGEYYTSAEDEIISTVLGSCVSVCLHDEYTGFGGMNHFILARSKSAETEGEEDQGRYGETAMKLLVDDLLSLGAMRRTIIAKVFGGASVLGRCCQSNRLFSENSELAKEFLETDGIPILASDVGGNEARRLYFDVRSGKVMVQHIKATRENMNVKTCRNQRNCNMSDRGPWCARQH